MLKKILLLLNIVFIVSNLSFGQKFINDYPGIPLIASAPWDCGEWHFDYIKPIADFVIVTELTQDRLNSIKSKGLKVIPAQTNKPEGGPDIPYNYVMKYSEGAYTVWEAEGTPVGKGDATLTLKTSIGTTFDINGKQGVVTKYSAGPGTLFDGPGYMQERKYWRIDKELGYIRYKADFNMMLETIIPGEGDPDDIICILQVTDSEISCCYSENEIFVRERVLRRWEFAQGTWQTFQLEYDFIPENIDEQNQPLGLNYTHQKYQNADPPNKNLADFVQFKVIWNGDPYTKLYVDNVIVYDDKGKAIVTNPAIQQNIKDQALYSFASNDLENYVTAWLTIDEPETIDNYEPIRVIDGLLKDNSQGKRGIWVSFPSSWNGKYGDSELGAEDLYKSNEFIQRTGITPHQNNHPLYHAPYRLEDDPNDLDFYVKNIRVLANDVLDKINDWDPLFSMTLLCGRVDEAKLFHDPEPHEMLYEANIKLMFGAKSLSLYRYFGGDDNPAFTGLVNYDSTYNDPYTGHYRLTDKYWFVRNTLAPRLKGSFGQKLKSLNQTEQQIEINAKIGQVINKNFVNKVQSAGAGDPCFVDVGFFSDPSDGAKKYFMLLNRYYSNQ